MVMNNLNFDERAILTAYKRFYGECYPAADPNKTEAHIRAQKMSFLLSVSGVNIGEFGYSWNFHGPYSAGLQSKLRALDFHANLVQEFYENNKNDTLLFSDGDSPSALFSEQQKTKIDNLSRSLKIKEGQNNKNDWPELLGSLAFLAQSVYPGTDFETINTQLKQVKSKFSNDQVNLNAWNTLRTAGII